MTYLASHHWAHIHQSSHMILHAWSHIQACLALSFQGDCEEVLLMMEACKIFQSAQDVTYKQCTLNQSKLSSAWN